MAKWVALIRGVNVGGGNRLPMEALRAAFAASGWQNVRTYIASGNIVFEAAGDAPAIAATLHRVLTEGFSIKTPLLIIPEASFRTAIAAAPVEPAEGRHLHGMFAMGDYSIDQPLADRLMSGSEAIYPQKGVVWIHAPEGIGRSKLAEKFDQVVQGTTVTGRNLNTLRALVRMLDD